jgi:Domain of unknown function (DUF4270)
MTIQKQAQITRIIFLLPVLAIFFLAGCQKPSINFGNSFTNANATNIIVVDTLSADLSTVLVDSFPTSGSGSLLIGRYKDSALGKITAGSFLEVAPPFNLPTISNLAGYDSLVLIIRPNKTFYGDTTQKQRYIVSQLTSIIQLPLTQSVFNNISSIAYDPVPLGSSDVTISPGLPFTSQLARDSLKIRLSDTRGKEIFGMLLDKSDTVRNSNSFLAYFKGLYISPDSNSLGGVYGFRDSVIMRLYYHEPGVFISNKFVDFLINNKSHQFNHIWFDRSGTALAALNGSNREIPSTATNNVSYIQSITGVETKIKFPTIWKLPQLPDYLSVLKAVLIVKPVLGSYSPSFALPAQLQLYTTDQNNFIGFPIANSGNLVTDYIYGANTAYTFDLTSYIRQQIPLGALVNSQTGLMLVIPSPANNTTFNRAIIGDKFNKKTNIVLKIYYASFF